MRQVPSSDMVSLISFLAVLLIFFSIDVRWRTSLSSKPWHARLFEWASRLGRQDRDRSGAGSGMGGPVPLRPEQSDPCGVRGRPRIAGGLCTIALGLEMLWQRWELP